MQMKWTQLVGLGAVVLASAAGCADRNNNGQPDSAATPGEVAQSTDTAVKKMGNAASGAGQSLENAATGAGKTLEGAGDAMTITPKVKTALGNNASLMGSRIDVDTNGTTNTVTLKGMVKNAAQSKLAQNLAQKSAGAGFKVVNQLKVTGGASSMMKKKM